MLDAAGPKRHIAEQETCIQNLMHGIIPDSIGAQDLPELGPVEIGGEPVGGANASGAGAITKQPFDHILVQDAVALDIKASQNEGIVAETRTLRSCAGKCVVIVAGMSGQAQGRACRGAVRALREWIGRGSDKRKGAASRDRVRRWNPGSLACAVGRLSRGALGSKRFIWGHVSQLSRYVAVCVAVPSELDSDIGSEDSEELDVADEEKNEEYLPSGIVKMPVENASRRYGVLGKGGKEATAKLVFSQVVKSVNRGG